MKYILVMIDDYHNIYAEYFDTKDALLTFLDDHNWNLIETVDWNHLEKYTGAEAQYIAYKLERKWFRLNAHLRVIE